jgi:hypothetical protein
MIPDGLPAQAAAAGRGQSTDFLGHHRAPFSLCLLMLQKWAIRSFRPRGWNDRPLNQHVATGILFGTLGVLVKHFGC